VCENLVEYMRAHSLQAPPLLRTVEPAAPVALEQVIIRLLGKSMPERFSSMRELKQMLELIQIGASPDVFARSSQAAPSQAAPQAAPGRPYGASPADGHHGYDARGGVTRPGNETPRPSYPTPSPNHANAAPKMDPVGTEPSLGRRILVIAITAILAIAAGVAAMLLFD
jgi:hypothetical protein